MFGVLDKYKCETEDGKNAIDDIKATVKSRICADVDDCQKNAEEYGSVEYEEIKENVTCEYYFNRLKEVMDFSKNVNSTSDRRVGIVNDDNLGSVYHKLKEKAEMLGENNDRLEEMLEMLRNVNFSNEKLIKIVEEKIKNIYKVKKSKEEKEEKQDEEEIEI